MTGETILVVDDEPAVRTVVRRMLEREGYTVLLTSSGEEALQCLADVAVQRTVRLALLDMSMPGMSGTEVRRELKERCPALPVVYFTGYALQPTDDVAGVIEKPITREALLNAVRGVLDRACQQPGDH